jgi:thiamine pyrophosphate-dependent acetolactate synthase large subunit-like protein
MWFAASKISPAPLKRRSILPKPVSRAVLVDIPKDVSQLETEFKYPHEVKRGYAPTYTGHSGQIRRATKALAQAKQPVLYRRRRL